MNRPVPAGARRLLSTDAAAFREAMSRVAGAVHVVTTDGPEGRAGYTATAVVSVSDRPATMLACLNRQVAAAAQFRVNGVMAINTLAAGDRAVADVFAGRTAAHGAAKFEAAGEWRPGTLGTPVLASALAVFECRIDAIEDVATHQVMIGEVLAIALGVPGPGLVYRSRAYHDL